MRTLWWAGLLLGVLLGMWADCFPVHAQAVSPDTVIATFRDARSLAVDPLGRLYVADAGRDVVRTFDRAGAKMGTFGGAGTRAGEFDEPTDVDPTNGQTVWVADAGNGRVQHLAAEGLFLEVMPVGPSVLEGSEQRFLDDGRDGAAVQGNGRPIAVASTSGDDVFAIDGRNDVLLTWDDRRRPERLLSSFGANAGVPRRPVSLALAASDRLYVADRGREAVLAYNLFGTFQERLPTPPLRNLQALSMHRSRLWIVCSGRVFVWNPDDGTTTEHAVDLPTPLVDAAGRGEDLFLLTTTTLYRRALW